MSLKGNNGSGSCTITLRPGTKVKIKIPYKMMEGQAWFAKQGNTIWFNGEERTDMVRGFLVENKNVGVINTTDKAEVAVIYEHLLDSENRIWFFAETGETAICHITKVPVHDHGSISQGGPAYATYFSGNIEDNMANQEQ